MLSILMVIERFWPLVGGSETQCFQISEELVKMGDQVTIVTKKWDRNSLNEENFKQGFKVNRLGIPGNGRFRDYLTGVNLFFWLIKNRDRYNIVYVNGGLANNFGSTAILAGKLLSKHVIGKVATPGELFFSGPHALSPKKFVHPLIKLRLFIAKKADYYTAHTVEVEKELNELGIGKSRVKKITNSVDQDFFKPFSKVQDKINLRKVLGLPQDKIMILYCGRLVKRKGLTYLFEAWKRIAEENSNSVLVILGSGKSQPDSVEGDLREKVTKEDLKNIYFVGEKEKEEVVKYLKAADIFVYPSIHPEGTALSILEAMSCELAVLGTDVGGIREMVENNVNGILVEKENTEGLFGALELLINNPQKRISFGKKARETVLRKYSTTKVAKDFSNFFEKLS